MSDELIKIPAFLAAETGDYGVMPMCDFCAEVACETAAMTCGQCSGQSCASQCAVSECNVLQCGQCGIAETGCGPQCFQCGTCESGMDPCEVVVQRCTAKCEISCQSCEGAACQSCQGCQDACEFSSQTVYTAPTFTISNITESGCDVNVRPGSGYTRYRVFARLTSDPDDKSYDYIFNTSSAFTATMDSLLPKTSYTVNVCGVIGNISDKWAGAKTFTTGSKARPGYFSWLRGPVASKPGTNELSSGAGIPPYLTASGWNAYTDNINVIREYRGLLRYGFTSAIAGRTVLSAAMVNEAIGAINDMSPPISTPAKAVSMSTPGSAALFNKLADSLNSIT